MFSIVQSQLPRGVVSRVLGLAAAMVAISGCASVGGSSIPSPEQLSKACNDAFVGRSLNDVMMRYGQPTGSVPYSDDITVYQFQASNTVRHQESVTSTTSGRIGPAGYSIPYSERAQATQGYDQTYACMMRVGVRSDGTVHGVDFVGKMYACQIFMP